MPRVRQRDPDPATARYVPVAGEARLRVRPEGQYPRSGERCAGSCTRVTRSTAACARLAAHAADRDHRAGRTDQPSSLLPTNTDPASARRGRPRRGAGPEDRSRRPLRPRTKTERRANTARRSAARKKPSCSAVVRGTAAYRQAALEHCTPPACPKPRPRRYSVVGWEDAGHPVSLAAVGRTADVPAGDRPHGRQPRPRWRLHKRTSCRRKDRQRCAVRSGGVRHREGEAAQICCHDQSRELAAWKALPLQTKNGYAQQMIDNYRTGLNFGPAT